MKKNLAKRFDQLTGLLFFLLVLFVSTVIWTHVANEDIVRSFYYYQLDKIIHLLAGWWVVAILFVKFRLRHNGALFLLICVAVLWEIFEFTFPDVRRMYSEKYVYWLKDTIGDIVADMLGGIVAFQMFSGKK